MIYYKLACQLTQHVDYCVGRLRVIFSIPWRCRHMIFGAHVEVPNHLAYVEWYTAFPSQPDPNNLMYKVSPRTDRDGNKICSIIPVSNIRRRHLFPKWGGAVRKEWTSSNVLDTCNVFFVNNFTDKHMYRIIY